MLLEPSVGSQPSSVNPNEGEDNLYLLQEQSLASAYSPMPSETTYPELEDFPHEEETNPTEHVDAPAYLGRQVPAPRVPFQPKGMRNTRPGWQDNRMRGMEQAVIRAALLICYCCYALGYTSNQCIHPMRYRQRVIANYEALSATQKQNVPDDRYRRAKANLATMEPQQRNPQHLAHCPTIADSAPAPAQVDKHPCAVEPRDPNRAQGN